MKLITSLLVLCLALSVGLAIAQTDMAGNMDNMSGMNNMTGETTYSVSGIMTLVPETMGSMTGTENMTGSQEDSNMTGMSNMTGAQTYSITATLECMPGAMSNITESKMCYITGTATSMAADMTGAQAGNMTGEQTGNQTGGQTYNITATVLCMPEAMNNMAGGAQAGNMTENISMDNMTGMDNMTDMDNMTGAQMCNMTGIMTLTPADITSAGNMTGMDNKTGAKTYSITATVECIPGAMSTMTGGAQAGNMTENMTGISNMTEAKMCYITGNATSMPAMIQAGNMTGAKTYSITSTVACMPEAGNMTGSMGNIMGPSQGKDIIETAKAAGNFTTLLAALNATNLTDILKGDGPFTVFAPTDKAFEALPKGTLKALLNDTSALKKILLYHVAGRRLMAKDVVNESNITTIEGQKLPVNVTDNGVNVGKAKIIMTDINASNGEIHAIDAVLIPPAAEEPTAAENMTGNIT